MGVSKRGLVLVTAALFLINGTAMALSGAFGPWSNAVRVETIAGTDPDFNGPALDGCPFVSRDGKMFFMASNRLGGEGGIDIWVASRDAAGDPWGAPVNVGPPVNSASNDFCPTLSRDGHTFFFVSNRPGGCGGDDIYTARLKTPTGFQGVANLGCAVNSVANEASPFPLPQEDLGWMLYFSSNRAGGYDLADAGGASGDPDIYVSMRDAGTYGPAALVSGVNSAAADGHPNVRRDGLEIFFFSNRPGAVGNDIYSASRASVWDPFGTPVNLGPTVNSAGSDTRPSLSWDGTTLYFGSTRTGGDGDSDHYVTTRTAG
jgi:Tol biopolymer transport system component